MLINNKPHRIIPFSCLPGIIASLLFGCTTPPSLIKTHKNEYYFSSMKSIVMSPVQVEVILQKDEDNLSMDEVNNYKAELRNWLEKHLLDQSTQKGLNISSSRVNNPITSFGQVLRTKISDEDARSLIHYICKKSASASVLVFQLRTHLGSDSRHVFKPFHISPRVGSSKTLLSGIMRDCNTGNVVWRNELFYRTYAKKGSELLNGAVNKILENLNLQ